MCGLCLSVSDAIALFFLEEEDIWHNSIRETKWKVSVSGDSAFADESHVSGFSNITRREFKRPQGQV